MVADSREGDPQRGRTRSERAAGEARELMELRERLRAELGAGEVGRLTRVWLVSQVARGLLALAAIAALYLVCWLWPLLGVTLMSFLVRGRVELLPGPGLETSVLLVYLGLAVGAAVVLLWIDLLAERAIGRALEPLGQRGYDLQMARRAMWAKVEWGAVEEPERTRSWRRRVEFSGAHLLWWSGFAAMLPVVMFRLPDWMWRAALSVAISGFLLKVWVPLVLTAREARTAGPETARREATLYYTWWARGWAPVVVALLVAAGFYVAIESIRL